MARNDMTQISQSQLRLRREACGTSQAELAEAIGLSRQSVNAIETGRSLPGVDVALRIAHELGASVEQLFGEGACTEPCVEIEHVGRVHGRVALAEVNGRWVAHGLTASRVRTSADALFQSQRGRWVRLEPTRTLALARANLVVMGCAAALGLLTDRLNTRRGAGRFVWLPSSSTVALEALREGRTHIAGVHLVDGRTGEANVADVKRHVGSERIVLVTLARWEAGLVIPRSRARVERPAHLARRGLRIVTRERGSGARRLFDRVLLEAGVGERRADAAVVAAGHVEVAQTIAMGAADVGIATRDVAIAFELGFLPLAEERYDLAIPISGLDDPRVSRLLEALTEAPLRRELSSLGYDMTTSGHEVARVDAAPGTKST